MAVAFPAPRITNVSASSSQATTWAGISALIASAAALPFAAVLAKPVSDIMFVRGSAYDGSWPMVIMIVLIMVAPACYALFFGAAGELLKTRMSPAAHKSTMRIAAVGMLPYIGLVLAGVAWSGGPQEALMIVAGLTIPAAMAMTIWVAGRADAIAA